MTGLETFFRRFWVVSINAETDRRNGVLGCGVEFPSGTAVVEWRDGADDDDDSGQTKTKAEMKDALTVIPGPRGAMDVLDRYTGEKDARVDWLD